MNQKTRAASESIGFLLLVGGILVVLNVIAANFPLGRFDLTRNEAFSLSRGSRHVASSLRDRMEITAYFSENLPPPFNATERYVRDLLAEYQAASNGKIRVRFVNPDTDEKRRQAEDAGVQKVGQQVVQNDSVSVVEGYRGLAITYLGETQAIPVIAANEGLEYQLTMLMKRMTGDKLKVGVLTGHQGPSLAQGLASLRRALPTYELVDVDANQPIDGSLRALLIVGPETAVTEAELRNIDKFVMEGHSLGIFGGGIKLTLEGAPAAQPVDSGLNRLIDRWGVHLNSDVVLDARCTRIPRPGPMGMRTVVLYPPMPVLVFDDAQMDHPAISHIPNAVFPFTSSLRTTQAPSGARVKVVGTSSDQSWTQTGESINLDVQQWQPTAQVGPFPLMVAIEGRLPSAFSSQASGEGQQGPAGPAQATRDVRVLVAGTSALARDEFLPQPDQVPEQQLAALLALPLNLVDWLANDADLIAVRSKNVDDPALDVPSAVSLAETEAISAAEGEDRAGVERALARRTQALEAWDRKKKGYRFANMLGIPVLFAVFGLLRWRSRQRKKESLAA